MFLFNPGKIYNQLSQLTFKLCSDQCPQCSGISLKLMLPCRSPQKSLFQKQLGRCRWDTYIKGGWRRQKYRRRSQSNCCYRRLVQQHHFNRLFRYICDVQFSERINKVWCTFFSTKFRNMFHLVLFFFKAAKHFN